MQYDFTVSRWNFSNTSTTVYANNMAARDRLCGGVSAEVQISAIPGFVERLEADGFTVEVQ